MTDHFPLTRFASKHVEKDIAGRRVSQALTIHGVTRGVVMEVDELGSTMEPSGRRRIASLARVTLERPEFGLQWNQVLESGGSLVGDNVGVSLDIQARRPAPGQSPDRARWPSLSHR